MSMSEEEVEEERGLVVGRGDGAFVVLVGVVCWEEADGEVILEAATFLPKNCSGNCEARAAWRGFLVSVLLVWEMW